MYFGLPPARTVAEKMGPLVNLVVEESITLDHRFVPKALDQNRKLGSRRTSSATDSCSGTSAPPAPSTSGVWNAVFPCGL